MASIIKVDTIQDLANTTSISVASLPKTAHANFFYAVNQDAGSLTISGTGGTGAKMSFNKIDSNVNISPNVTDSTWTHAYTGRYVLRCQYRQDSGGDIWTVKAVTKGGDTVAVGISARTGSGNGSIPIIFEVYYTVDSTTATYQLQHWTNSTTKTVSSGFAGSNPSWTNYSTLTGGVTGSYTGRMVNYVVYRVGD